MRRVLMIAVLLVAMPQLAYGQATPEPAPAEPEQSPQAPEQPAPEAPDAPADAPDAPADAPAAPADAPAAPADAPDAPVKDEKVTPPVVTKDVKPVYPAQARAERIAAQVVVELDIDAEGKVEDARLLEDAEATGYGFDEAAIAAARQLEFSPARIGDQAIPVTIAYRFRFVPDVESKPPPADEAPEPTKAGPTGEVVGTIIERGTRLPVVGAKVTIFRGEGEEAEGYETETDENGRFAFTELEVGSWRLYSRPEGYYPIRLAENVQAGRRTVLVYRIEKQSYNEYDVLVKTDKVQREVSQTSIDAKQAEQIPGTFGDVLAVVQNFPGVARSVLPGQIVIRGSDPSDTQIFVDGIDVPILYHFGGLRSVLPVGVLERINFYPGNFSVEYGRATGGVIDIDLKELAPQKWGGYLDTNILDSSLYLEVPITDKLAVAGSVRRSYLDQLIEPFLPESGNTFTLPRYQDAQLLASYRPSPAHQLQSLFFYSADRFAILFDDPEADPNSIIVNDVGFEVDFYRGLVKYRYVPSPRFQNDIKLSAGFDRTDFRVGDSLRINIETTQAQLREIATYKLSDWLTLRGGLDYLFTRSDFELRVPEDEDDSESTGPLFTNNVDNAHSAAAYVQLELAPIDGLSVVPGVRGEYFSRTDQWSFSPRVTARYQAHPQWMLEAGVGLFTQEAEFFEADENIGNPDLATEKAIHYSLGFEYQPRDHIKLEVTGYYKQLYDLIVESDEAIEVGDELLDLRLDNIGSGRVIGMEVSVRHELSSGLFGWLAYTLSRSERKDSMDEDYALFDFDQTHILTLVLSQKLPRNWQIGGRLRVVSGNLFTPIEGGVYSSDSDTYLPIMGPTNSARLGTFTQLDVRIDKRWIYDNWILAAYLDIQNVTDRANPEGVSYNFDLSEQQTAVTGLPIVPVLGVRGEF